MNRVSSSETTRDKNRLKKFEILLNKNQPKHKINTVDILNLTDFEIPQEVREILKFGINEVQCSHYAKNSLKTIRAQYFPIKCESKIRGRGRSRSRGRSRGRSLTDIEIIDSRIHEASRHLWT